MVWFDDGSGEVLALVVGEFSADEFGESGLVAEEGTGAVNGDKAAAFLYKASEVAELPGRDCLVVGVEEDAVEPGKIFVIPQGLFDICMVIKVDGLAAQGL